MNENEKMEIQDMKPDYANEIIAIIKGNDSPSVMLNIMHLA